MTVHLPALDFQATLALGEVLAKSGFFADTRSAAQAVVKIMAGAELGFGPIASMSGVHVIEGKPSIGAHLMAAKIKASGRYDYQVVRCDRSACHLRFLELRDGKWAPVGDTEMSYQEAVDTGLALGRDGKPKSNWARSSDDMLFARCLTKGYRRYCPDLTTGCPAYDPDELDQLEQVPEADRPLLPTVAEGPPRPALPPPPATIDEQQQDELKALARAALKDRPGVVTDLLHHFEVKGLLQLPASRFAEARAFLSPAPAAPPINQTDLSPLSPLSPCSGEGPCLSPEQVETFKKLFAQHQVDGKGLLAFLGVERVSLIQASWFHWVRLMLPSRPDWHELRKAMRIDRFAGLRPDRVEALTRSALMGRIDQLTLDLAITAESWNARLDQLFGHHDTTRLTLDQLVQVEARLADHHAKKAVARP